MDTIQTWITVLLALLPAGAAIRAVVCLIKILMDADQEVLYKHRLKNLLIFTALAECTLGLLYCVYAYF